jgi:hypothetical protein
MRAPGRHLSTSIECDPGETCGDSRLVVDGEWHIANAKENPTQTQLSDPLERMGDNASIRCVAVQEVANNATHKARATTRNVQTETTAAHVMAVC